MVGVEWVVFDLGETLTDETRYWRQWAVELGIPEFTWFAVLGGVIARGLDHREAFQVVRPGFDLRAAVARRDADGYFGRDGAWFDEADFHPDALACIGRLRESGLRIGIAANQAPAMEARLLSLGIAVDLAASSGRWGVQKPAGAFFERLAAEAGAPPHRIAYVGDRVDNDVLPARRAGMRAVFLRRGPWAFLQQHLCPDDVDRIESLDALPALLGVQRGRGGNRPPGADSRRPS
jgi:FMN phosphatase YigB (HAD superfamily)